MSEQNKKDQENDKEKHHKEDEKTNVNDPNNNVIDPDKKGTGLGLKSHSGAETELETGTDEEDNTDPTVRLKRKEDLRRGLNQSNPNNMNNNSNTLLDNE